MQSIINMDHNKPTNRSFTFCFLALSLSLILGLSVLLGFMFSNAKQEILNFIQADEINKVTLGATSIRRELMTNKSDLLFLSDLIELKQLLETSQVLDTNDDDLSSLLSREYLMFALRKGIYDQIRFLNTNGDELLRINFNDGHPAMIPLSQLQSKNDRYYFTYTLGLGRNEVYISPFDLNVENNKVEIPLKPTIRFGTPIFDQAHNKRGILVVNYLGSQLIHNFKSISADKRSTPSLLNSDGYWLSSDSADNEWGFMFPDKKDCNYQTVYPNAWNIISNGVSGQFSVDGSLFTYETISPFGGSISSFISDGNNYVWKIVSRVPQDTLALNERPLTIRYVTIWTVLAISAVLFSYFYIQNLWRKNEMKAHLHNMATHDHLTGLPNRVLFLARLEEVLKDAKRYQHYAAVFFLDLDGFKKINDNYGHDIGDLLLIEVAARMKKCIKDVDTVARIGGDEFTIILSQINNSKEAATIATCLISEISLPFHLPNHTCTVGVSIGIGLYPHDATDVASLLQKADTAMYTVKKNNKNNYEFAPSSV